MTEPAPPKGFETGIADYFAYEAAIGERQLGPLFQKSSLDLNGKDVLDVGCGYGGVLQGLRRIFPRMQAVGLDKDGDMIESGRRRLDTGIELRHQDFFACETERFDVLLLRDVLEHIGDYERALEKTRALLKPEGRVFVTFAPFLGPFGGHQHNASGLASHCPWIHLLPGGIMRRLLSVQGNSYKGKDALDEDIRSVLATRLTVGGFKTAARRLGFRLQGKRLYLSRPEYRFKFGLPAIALPDWPGTGEWLCTGAEFLLQA